MSASEVRRTDWTHQRQYYHDVKFHRRRHRRGDVTLQTSCIHCRDLFSNFKVVKEPSWLLINSWMPKSLRSQYKLVQKLSL